MQSKDELERFYDKYDPWGYETNMDDIERKQKIINLLGDTFYERVLDIGCGHGFVTKDIKSAVIEGIELSDNAASHLPSHIKRVFEPSGQYDLVMATGIMYQQYAHDTFYSWIINHSSRHILIAGIENWLIDYDYKSKIVDRITFQYREFTQVVTLYNRVFE